jgi:hypothetical protein
MPGKMERQRYAQARECQYQAGQCLRILLIDGSHPVIADIHG